MSLKTEIRDHGSGARYVIVSGRLDSDTAPDLETALAPVLDSPPPVVVLDMQALEYVSSAGLRVIFKLNKAMEKASSATAMVNLQPQVKKVFEIVRALPDFDVFESDAELDDYLDHMQAQTRDLDGDIPNGNL